MGTCFTRCTYLLKTNKNIDRYAGSPLRNMISGLNEREMGNSQTKQVGRETSPERLPIKIITKLFYLALSV